MNYCILRAEKLTSFGSITGSAMHTFREVPTLNADASRTHLNKTWGAKSAAEVRQAINAKLPQKRRKDAVLCIEYLVTASPEWFYKASTKQQAKYFNDAINWLRNRHGAANIVCVNFQQDEKSPHLVAYIVPLTKDGRLSAKDFLGGRKVLSEMQTNFAEKVGKPAGLQRGLEGSKVFHTTAKQYNSAIAQNTTLAPPTPLLRPSFVDRLTGRAKQAEEKHKAEQVKYGALVERAAKEARFNRRARIAQAKRIEELRKKEVEAQRRHEAEVISLREEKERLARELRTQRTQFERQIDGLKVQLAKAVNQVKGFIQKISRLTRERDQAEVEVEELRKVLYQTDQPVPATSNRAKKV